MAETSKGGWLAETLRATAFGETSIDQAKAWWQAVCKDDPDSETVKAKQNQYAANIESLGGILSLQVQSNRTDWFLRAKLSEAEEDLSFPAIGLISKVAPSFAEICNSWYSQEPQIQRLAFGSVLFLPIENRVQGYNALSEFLSTVKIDPEGSEDIFYQINRPRNSKSGVEDLILNRLSKWSLLRLSAGEFSFDSDEAVVTKPQGEAFAARLELDINTSPKFRKLLPVNRLSDIFNELMALGLEISDQGDIP